MPRAAAAIAKEIKVTRDAEPATPPEGALSFQLELPGLRPEDLRVVVQVRVVGLGLWLWLGLGLWLWLGLGLG